MANTLSNVLQGAYRKIGQMNTSILTSGTTTTAIDTKLTGSAKLANKDWPNGCLFVIRTTDGLAPQGEFQRISTYDNATQKFTVDTVFSAALEAGDIVGFVGPDYPYRQAIEQCNDALRSFGDVELVDTSSITVAASQTEYSLPASWKDVRPLEVAIQGILNYSTMNMWNVLQGWEFVPPATVGAQSKIILPYLMAVGYALRVKYRGPHPALTVYSDPVSDMVDPEVIVLATAVQMLDFANIANSGGDVFLSNKAMSLRQELDRKLIERPVERDHHQPILFAGFNSADRSKLPPSPITQ